MSGRMNKAMSGKQWEVRVGSQTDACACGFFQAKNILVATGSAAMIPPIEAGKDFAITSDHILNLDELPRKCVFTSPALACSPYAP